MTPETVPLSKVADLRGGYAFKSQDYRDSGHFVLRTVNISDDGRISRKGAVYISESQAPEYERFQLRDGDTLFVMVGATLGKVGYVKGSDLPALLNQNMWVIRALNSSETSPRYINYWFQWEVQKTLQWQSGSARGFVKRDDYRSLPFPNIKFSEQQTIAAVLSSLDDKIDLLHRQNKTLEAMAEALFRQWFVEEAQEDWEVGKLKQYVDIGIGRTPPRQEHQWFSENETDVKWISIKDLGNDGAFIFNTAEYLTRDAVEKFNIPVIPENTVVLSFKMTVGRVAITTEAMLSNEAIAHFRFRPDTPFIVEYLYLFLKSYQYELLGSTSSIVTAINSAMIKDMEITIPDEKSMARFDKVVSGMFKKVRDNQLQIRTLERLRDTLLPKLMSGEVRVAAEA